MCEQDTCSKVFLPLCTDKEHVQREKVHVGRV